MVQDPVSGSGNQPPVIGQPRVIGLLGGIASGKSLVAAELAKRGFLAVDADRLARERLESAELRPALVQLLGPEILGPAGAVDRQRIAERVFQDPALRSALEDLIHPAVRQEILGQLAAARAAGRSVVLDVPLLLERGLVEECDLVLMIEVPDDLRRQRALARGMPEEDWRRREAAQADLEAKRRRAHHVVDNSGPPERVGAQLDAILEASRARESDDGKASDRKASDREL